MSETCIIQVDESILHQILTDPRFEQVKQMLRKRMEMQKEKLVTAKIDEVPKIQATIAELKYTLRSFAAYTGGYE